MNQIFVGYSGPPLTARLEHDGRVVHVERRVNMDDADRQRRTRTARARAYERAVVTFRSPETELRLCATRQMKAHAKWRRAAKGKT